MWIRILGILYNLTLVQSIEYCIKKKELYFHYGAIGAHRVRSEFSNPVHDTVTISFIRHDYGNEYGLAVYAQIIKELKVFDSDPIESDRVLGIAGPPFEGAHPDAEFIEG